MIGAILFSQWRIGVFFTVVHHAWAVVNLLVQVAAESNVEFLKAATDAKKGRPRFKPARIKAMLK